MAKHIKKGDLPTKLCPVCERPFTYRKKWQDCWDEVIYCSDRCKKRRNKAKKGSDADPNG